MPQDHQQDETNRLLKDMLVEIQKSNKNAAEAGKINFRLSVSVMALAFIQMVISVGQLFFSVLDVLDIRYAIGSAAASLGVFFMIAREMMKES